MGDEVDPEAHLIYRAWVCYQSLADLVTPS